VCVTTVTKPCFNVNKHLQWEGKQFVHIKNETQLWSVVKANQMTL